MKKDVVGGFISRQEGEKGFLNWVFGYTYSNNHMVYVLRILVLAKFYIRSMIHLRLTLKKHDQTCLWFVPPYLKHMSCRRVKYVVVYDK